MQNSPKFSIIVPAYNAQRTILRCLNSVLSQTEPDFEVIVIDDESNDETLRIVNGIDDERISLLEIENSGPGVARNIGLDKAKGEWVFCLDADDFIDDRLLERVGRSIFEDVDVVLLNFATFNEACKTKFPAGWSYRNTKVFKDDSKTVFTYDGNENLFFETVQSIPWNKVVKRSLLIDNNIKFSEIYLSEDMMYSFPACILAKGIIRLREPLVFHSEYSGVSSMDKKNEHPLDFLQALAELKGFLIERGKLDVFREAYFNWTLQSLSYNLFSHNDEIARALQIEECMEVLPELIESDFDSIRFVENEKSDARCKKQTMISWFARTKLGFSILDKTIHAARRI